MESIACPFQKHLVNHTNTGTSSSRGSHATPPTSLINNSSALTSTPSSSASSWRLIKSPQIIPNTSWKTNHRPASNAKSSPAPASVLQPRGCSMDNSRFAERALVPAGKGLQICWTPLQDIQAHFIEVVFSNQSKCDGGPIRAQTLYQHLGIAQLFYQNSDGAYWNCGDRRDS